MYYLTAKNYFVAMYHAARTVKATLWWEKRIAWCDKKLKQRRSREIEFAKRLKLLVWIVNVAVILSIICTGCNTVQGIGHDTVWIGKAGQQMLEHGHESMK